MPKRKPSFQVIPKAKWKTVVVDFSSHEKISKAEKEKSKYENQGYKFEGTKQVGFDKFVSYYSKPKSKSKLRKVS